MSFLGEAMFENLMTTEINWLLFFGLFFMTFMLDLIEVTFVMSVQNLQAVRAASCRLLIMFIMAVGVMNYVANPLYIIPICLGSFCGTYFTVSRKKRS